MLITKTKCPGTHCTLFNDQDCHFCFLLNIVSHDLCDDKFNHCLHEMWSVWTECCIHVISIDTHVITAHGLCPRHLSSSCFHITLNLFTTWVTFWTFVISCLSSFQVFYTIIYRNTHLVFIVHMCSHIFPCSVPKGNCNWTSF